MSRLLISDIKSHTVRSTVTGHGFAVAENYLRVFRKSVDVKIVGGPSYQKKFGEDALALPYDTDSAQPGWLNKLRVLLNMRKLFRIGRDDTIVLQSSAVVTSFIGIALWKHPQTKLFLILYNRDALNSHVKRLLFRLAKRNINGVICPYQDIGAAYGLPACVVPDYIYTDDRHRDALIPYAERKYDFCMLGLIWRDKGIVEVARRLAGTPYKVLIAGMPSEEEGLREELQQIIRRANNIECHLRYLSLEEYESYMMQSRYCVLNYSGCYSERSSGVVLDSIFHGVPVIGRKCRALQFIEENGLGKTFEDLEQFHPEELMNESVYNGYIEAIQGYYKKHQEYREKLIRFIEG